MRVFHLGCGYIVGPGSGVLQAMWMRERKSFWLKFELLNSLKDFLNKIEEEN